MCFVSRSVTRKVFDYNAYIEGRRKGLYVVIYHDVTDETDQIPENNTAVTEGALSVYNVIDAPSPDLEITDVPSVQDRTLLVNDSAISSVYIPVFWVETISIYIPPERPYPNAVPIVPLTKAAQLYCRGAPL